ncbi:ROK family protein [Planctomonas psychrotolerans]|uniref:ROK family protein n=1 Tax=Planctomonas psychrotolerans TaxID=2528712 RepID=UPI00123B06A9|nr:ROK family protein [Planctomonas psychrotolerans]
MSNPTPTGAVRRRSLDIALRHAWENEVFTASDVMSVAGLTRSTTIDVIDELVELGVLRELPNARAGGDYRKGRPARRFALRTGEMVVVGTDAGRAHLTTVVADLRGGELTREHVILDPEHDSVDERRAAVTSAVDAALRTAGRSRKDVLSICIGVPAPVDRAGMSPPHRAEFWRRMNPDLAALFGEWVPLVRVENDASLAAVAEGTVGAAVGCRDYVTLLAGERLGAGVVVDGVLLRGRHGGVGEMVAFDHVIGVEGAWGLGSRAAQWAREAVAAGEVSEGSPLATVPVAELDGRTVLEAARRGDPDAERVMHRVGAMLGVVTGILGSLFDPARVVVSGSIADGAAELIGAARAALPRELDLPAPELVASRLGGDVVSIGAVSAALEAARDGMLDLACGTRRVG